MDMSYLPSPTRGVWALGPLPVRAYALCILLGILVAIALVRRRWSAGGGASTQVVDISVTAVVGGIVGARVYHVLTDPELYFAAGRDPWDAVKIWDGGLGIPGGLMGGALAAWWACRRAGIALTAYADAAAPGVALAQAIGRWGNWFNNELYGRPTTLPWKLKVYEWADGRAVTTPEGEPVVLGYFHPTFLYESLWNVGLAATLLLIDRRRQLSRGHLFATYVAGYALGRLWIEALRSDFANTIFGLRVNIWVSLLALAVSLAVLVLGRRTASQRDDQRT